MGITRDFSKFLIFAKKYYSVSYNHTLTLGRQVLYFKPEELKLDLKHYGELDAIAKVNFSFKEYAENYFYTLGASVQESLDYSDYEKANVIHDLNKPVPESLENRYSAVVDAGTLEHVFNFPLAIKNCMKMLKVGGHFISITTANNYFGHGFYQFSPELFFSLFSEKSGFQLKEVIVAIEKPDGQVQDWYRVIDPAKVKRRVTLINNSPTSLLIIAKKITEKNIEGIVPFQSDYEQVWRVHESIAGNKPLLGESRWLHLYRKLFPKFIKSLVRKIFRKSTLVQKNVTGLGLVDPAFFQKIKIE